MEETVRIVAHFLTGRLLKGTTQDFFPNRASFHLKPTDGGAPVEVPCRDLKAVFFVKDFAGNSNRRDLRGFISAPGETSLGKKIAVLFKDGELLCGYTLSYMPDRPGFFMTPADKDSNSLRVYVVATATVEVKAGPAADLLVTRALATKGK